MTLPHKHRPAWFILDKLSHLNLEMLPFLPAKLAFLLTQKWGSLKKNGHCMALIIDGKNKAFHRKMTYAFPDIVSVTLKLGDNFVLSVLF